MGKWLALFLCLMTMLLSPPNATAQDNDVSEVLLSAVTTGNGGYQLDQERDLTFLIEWSAGVSAGAVVIEEATSTSYAGTWSVISTTTTSAASSTDVVHLSGSWMAIRARVSTTVVGGTVTVTMVGD